MRAKIGPLAILLSTVFCGGMLVLSTNAQAVETFRPQGNWAVSKVAAKQTGATPYCALARRFGNGSILTFARNSFNETSVAVDFPAGDFQTGKNYTVVFDPGQGETRSYQTMPVSERGVVIRMGRDDKFYTALEQSGQLGVNIDDQSFVFALPDVQGGTQDLAACLGTTIEPAAGEVQETAQPVQVVETKVAQAPVPAPAPVPVVDNSQLQSLQEENIRLRNALERERRVYEDKMQQADNTSATAELSEKLRLLEIENRELRAQAANAVAAPVAIAAAPVTCEANPANETETLALKSEATVLRDENNRLKLEIQTQQQQIAALVEAQKSAPVEKISAGPSADVIALEKRAGEAEIQLAGLKDQVGKLQAENNALKATISAAQVTASSSTEDLKANVATISKMKALEAQLAEIQSERDRLAGEVASIKNADADGRVQISSENWNLEQATRRFNEAEKEIRRLGSTLEQERAKCAVEKKDLEYMLFDPKIAEKQQIAKLINLEEQLIQAKATLEQQADGDKEQVAAYEKRVQDLESRVAAETQKISAAESRAKDLEQQLSVAKLSLQQAGGDKEKIAAFEQSVKTLEQQLAEANTALKDAGGDKERIASYEKNVKTLEQELAAAKTALQQQAGSDNAKIASYEANIKALEQKLAVAVTETASLRKNVEVLERERGAANDQVAIVNALKQEIASLNGQVENLQSEKSGMAAQLAQISTSAGGDATSTTRAKPPVEVERVDYDAVAVGNPVPVTAQALEASVPVMASIPQVVSVPVPELVAAAAPSNLKLMKQSEMESLLSQAGVDVSGGVQPIGTATGNGRVAYRWQTGGLFGTAEQKGVDSPSQFDGYVSEYLNKTKSRCTGQFAAIPALVDNAGGNRISAYEIACVDDTGAGASAALIFESRNGVFTTIAHESSPESMDIAMDARDKIIAVLQEPKTASR
ncbi:MAG: hypothetical protein ACXW30_00545 [Micavibrio sp.]